MHVLNSKSEGSHGFLHAGMMDAHMAAGCPTVNGEQAGVRKRGVKPKYKFVTAEEAVAHRFFSAYPVAAFIFAVELHSVGSSRHASTICLCAVLGRSWRQRPSVIQIA